MRTSPEAEQAAEKWWALESDPNYWLMLEREKACEAYAIGYDAATAKLREELVFIKTEHAILNARLHGEVHPKDNGDWHGMINIPKLREELDSIRIAAAGHFEKDDLNVPIPLARRIYLMSCQLAHQQPSDKMSDAEWKGFLSTDQPSVPEPQEDNCTCDIDTVCQVHGGPIAPTPEDYRHIDGDIDRPAPTPDVEKIALEFVQKHFVLLPGFKIKDLDAKTTALLAALAQACAPLVKAIEKAAAMLDDAGVSTPKLARARRVLTAALTGEKP